MKSSPITKALEEGIKVSCHKDAKNINDDFGWLFIQQL